MEESVKESGVTEMFSTYFRLLFPQVCMICQNYQLKLLRSVHFIAANFNSCSDLFVKNHPQIIYKHYCRCMSTL